ncbi:response regulator transcription factor [Tenacibaculum sp. 190524A02b]|uniref:response regulator transcription factor n=1 Tax=Tenacibaculum vairaonense TaxID=3137860 RepID=UPI0031FB1008
MTEGIRVHAADNHYIAIMGYKVLLEEENCTVVSTSENGREVVKWAEENDKNKEADVLLLDLSMPVLNGIEVLEYFQKHGIHIPTVVVTSYLQDHFIKKVFDAGALSYISKSDRDLNLPKAVLAASQGQKFIPDYIQEIIDSSRLYKVEKDEFMNLNKTLSKKEFATLDLIIDGKNTSEIIKELDIDKSSFHTFTRRIREKFGVGNNVALIKKLFRNNH